MLDWVQHCVQAQDWAQHCVQAQDWVPRFEEGSRRATHFGQGPGWVPRFAKALFQRANSVGEMKGILLPASVKSAVFRFFPERRWVHCVQGPP